MRGADVEVPVRLTLLAAEPVRCEPTTLTSTLRYCPADPYAVSIVFPAAASSPGVTWTFDRDLLRSGIAGAAGVGDVRIRAVDAADRGGHPDTALITLTAPGGRAVLSAPLPVLRRFLDAASAVVAFGREPDFVDLDGELEALLGRAG